MGWGGKKKVEVPDTSAQENEIRRQTDALIAQFQAMMEAQDRMFRDQQAADQTRFEQQRAGDLAEAERQRSILMRQLEDQNASQAEINARVAQQQREAEAQAAARAASSRQYAEGRSSLIDQVSGALDGAFGGFDDSYFDQYAKTVLNASRPTIDRQYADDRRDARLSLSENGNLNSSAAARALGLVQEKYKANLGAKAGEAADAATRLRGEIDSQKRQALSGLVNSAFVGDEDLPDGVTDVDGTLGTIASRLNNYVRGVTENVRTYVPMAGSGVVQAPTITAPTTNASSLLLSGITSGGGAGTGGGTGGGNNVVRV